jgi:hypothetical protein
MAPQRVKDFQSDEVVVWVVDFFGHNVVMILTPKDSL